MKPARADQIRKREIQLIHVGKSALKMDEDSYRAMLFACGRVKSSTELDWTGRKRVLDHLKKCGFTPSKPKAVKIATDESPQMKKIRALWLTLADEGVVKNRSEKALGAYIKRQSGVDAKQWLHGVEASRVIEALKAWAAREGVEVF